MLKRNWFPSPLERVGHAATRSPQPIQTWRVIFVVWLVVRVAWWVWRMPPPTSQLHESQRTPLELGKLVRHELERLGGLWVKTAHIMGARRDIFPASFCHELLQTREWTAGYAGVDAKRFVERELGRPIDEASPCLGKSL